MSDNNEQPTQQQQAPLQHQQTVTYLSPQFQTQYVHQPLVQSQVVTQPLAVGGLQQSTVHVSSVPVEASGRTVVKGESRIEYIPYEKTVIEYEAVQRVEYVPKEKKVTDYYAVEYQTEYIPQVYQDRYIDYVPTERVQERIEYQAIEKQVVHQPVQEVQQVQQVYVQQAPVVTQQLVSSQVHVVPQTQTVTVQQPTNFSFTPSVQYAPVQQSVVYQTNPLVGSVYRPVVSHNVNTATSAPQQIQGNAYGSGSASGNNNGSAAGSGAGSATVKPVQQPPKEKGFLERIFE